VVWAYGELGLTKRDAEKSSITMGTGCSKADNWKTKMNWNEIGGIAYWLDCQPRPVNFPYPALD